MLQDSALNIDPDFVYNPYDADLYALGFILF